jgi:hypothetical protein
MLDIHLWERKSSNLLAQRDNGGSPAACFKRGIAKALNEWRFGQNGADHLALDTDSTAMHNPQRLKAGSMRFFKIFLNDRFNIARWNTMQVEYVCDGNPDRVFVHAPLLLA